MNMSDYEKAREIVVEAAEVENWRGDDADLDALLTKGMDTHFPNVDPRILTVLFSFVMQDIVVSKKKFEEEFAYAEGQTNS